MVQPLPLLKQNNPYYLRWNLQLNDFEDRFNDYFNGMADTLADIDVKNSIGKENLVFY